MSRKFADPGENLPTTPIPKQYAFAPSTTLHSRIGVMLPGEPPLAIDPLGFGSVL
jgi:hypothetical protein